MMSDSKMHAGQSKTITRLSDQMISIEHRLNVIQEISHLISANKRRNMQFFNGVEKLEAIFVFPKDSCLASARN